MNKLLLRHDRRLGGVDLENHLNWYLDIVRCEVHNWLREKQIQFISATFFAVLYFLRFTGWRGVSSSGFYDTVLGFCIFSFLLWIRAIKKYRMYLAEEAVYSVMTE
jgi:hypothetical protein